MCMSRCLSTTHALPTGERGYHVFYELIRGGEAELMRDCCLQPPPPSRFISEARLAMLEALSLS